jgi:60 kDa SS-A/Ro ribonucleoprotein
MARGGHIFGQVGPLNPLTGQVMSAAYNKADKLNKAGTPAFSRSIEEDTLAVLTTQTLSNTFYASQKELAQETVEVLRKMSDKDPVFLAKALIYARNKGLMKLAPTVGLAVLSENKTEHGKKAFSQAFRHVIRIPDDLREFVELIRTGSFGGKKALMGVRKIVVQNWLRHMSEYHGLKYGSANSEGITLRDILRLTHPLPKVLDRNKDGKGPSYDRLRSGAQAELFGWLVKGWENVGKEPSPSNALVWAFEKIKRSEDEKEIVSLVKKYKLPWEVVVPAAKKMTKGIWTALLDGMPYMALLRNLNTMERHEVLKDDAIVKDIAKRLSDPEAVAKCKQLPFRFFNAEKAYKGPQKIVDAIHDAMEQSFVNMPEIKDLRVAVSNDSSGSMGSQISEKGTATYADVACIFAAALFKKCEDVVLLPFDTEVYPEKGRVTKRSSILGIADKLRGHGGGTNVGAPLKYLREQKIKVDVWIGITDAESWAGRGFLTELEEYRKKINPKLKCFLITIAPYQDGMAPVGYPDVDCTYGWSDSILKYIGLTLSGGAGQVDDVKAIDLDSYGKKAKEEEVEAPVSAD